MYQKSYEKGTGLTKRSGKAWETWDSRLSDGALYFPRMVEAFLESQGWNYEEFYRIYNEASKSPDKRDLAMLKGKILMFVENLRTTTAKTGRPYSKGTAKLHLIAIKSFIELNELPRLELTRSEVKRVSSTGSAKEKDSYTKAELRTLLESTTSLRNKAIIYMGKDSGMRIGDMCVLKIDDVFSATKNGDKFIMLDIVQRKTERAAHPCIGYEALNACEKWLRWRRENGFSVDPDQPLFIQLEGENRGKAMTRNSLTIMVIRAVKTAGLGNKVLSAHCLRVYHQSQLEAASVNKNVIYRLQGRKIPDSGRSYSKGEIFEVYKVNYGALTLDQAPQIIEVKVPNEEVERLTRENSDLRRRIEEKDDEMGRMWLALGDLKRQVDEFLKLRE